MQAPTRFCVVNRFTLGNLVVAQQIFGELFYLHTGSLRSNEILASGFGDTALQKAPRRALVSCTSRLAIELAVAMVSNPPKSTVGFLEVISCSRRSFHCCSPL